MIYNVESFSIRHLLTRWLFYTRAVSSTWAFSLDTLRDRMQFFEMVCGRIGGKPGDTIFSGERVAEPLRAMQHELSEDNWLTLLYVIHDLGPLVLGDLPQMSQADLEALRARLSHPSLYAQATLILCETGGRHCNDQVIQETLHEVPTSQWAHCFAPFVKLRRCMVSWLDRMSPEAWRALDKDVQRWLAALWWMHCSDVQQNDVLRPMPAADHMLVNRPMGDWLSYLGMAVVSATPKNKAARLQDENIPQNPLVREFVEDLFALAIVVQSLMRYGAHPDYRDVIVLKPTWAKEVLGLYREQSCESCVVSPREVWRLNESSAYPALEHALQVSPWLAAAWLRWLSEVENDVLIIAESARLVDRIWGLERIYLEPEVYAHLAQKLAMDAERAAALNLAHRMQELARLSKDAEANMWDVYCDVEEITSRLIASHGEDAQQLVRAMYNYQSQ